MCWSQLEAIGLFCCDADENEGVFLFTSSGTLVEKHEKKIAHTLVYKSRSQVSTPCHANLQKGLERKVV
jgi:hypothetical protein